MNIKASFFAVLISILTCSAYAGFYFEPRLGYQMGTYKGAAVLTSLAVMVTDNETSGSSYGAMAGYRWSTFSLGVEGLTGTLTNEDKTTKLETDFEFQDVGFFLRWDIGGFHISTSFLSSSSTDEDLKNNGLKDTMKGTGMRFGIGYRLFENFSINVDYIAVDYDKTDEPTFLAAKSERTTTMIGISMPLGLGKK